MDEAAKPRSLGNYSLLASLATGGMAKVYLALRAGPSGFNKLLVVKVLRDDAPAGAEDGLRMFWDEARLSAQLVHPNIVHTYEVGETNGEYFLAMEYLDGQTYRTVAKRALNQGGLTLAEHLRILSETARGLHYAHQLKDFSGRQLGVVHRDVSPQNLFITYDGQVKVLDFGIAKTRDAEHKTQVGVIKGKVDYMAPEQLRGDELDGRADVFALGVMLWEAIAGTRFAGGRQVTQVARLHARLAGSEPKLREVAPETPEALLRIVDKAIALDPRQRFEDAAAFADAVDHYVASLGGAAPSAKSLSVLMASSFESERATMHKLIEQQILAVQRGFSADNTGELPRLITADARSSSGQYIGELDDRSSSGHNPGVALGTAGAAKLRPRSPVSLKLVSAAAAVMIGGSLAWFTSGTPERAGAGEELSQRAQVGAIVTPERTESAPAAIAEPSPIPATPATVPAPRADQVASVIVDFRVTPSEAKVTLDGAIVPTPFSGEFARSSLMRRIEVTAPGYRPFSKLLPFDQNRNIVVELEPLAPAARRSRPARSERDHGATVEHTVPSSVAPPAHVNAPAADPAPGSDLAVKPRARSADIDVSDPYAK